MLASDTPRCQRGPATAGAVVVANELQPRAARVRGGLERQLGEDVAALRGGDAVRAPQLVAQPRNHLARWDAGGEAGEGRG